MRADKTRDVEAESRALRRRLHGIGTLADLEKVPLGDLLNAMIFAQDVDDSAPFARRALAAFGDILQAMSNHTTDAMPEGSIYNLYCMMRVFAELDRRLEEAGEEPRGTDDEDGGEDPDDDQPDDHVAETEEARQ